MAKQVKTIKQVPKGKIYILSSFNNTLISATDPQGNVIAHASTGMAGFKGTKKSTPFAASQTMKMLLEKAKVHGLKETEVFVKGVGSGRDGALRGLSGTGIQVLSIKDITPVAHGGVRAKKARRV